MFFFFFHDTATTKIYTLSLHDALPISAARLKMHPFAAEKTFAHGRNFSIDELDTAIVRLADLDFATKRSEEHTSELQSHSDLVCRLLLEKKKQNTKKEKYTFPLFKVRS